MILLSAPLNGKHNLLTRYVIQKEKNRVKYKFPMRVIRFFYGKAEKKKNGLSKDFSAKEDVAVFQQSAQGSC